MIKKFSTILLTLLLLVTNISFVLAEEGEETDSNDNEPITTNTDNIDNTKDNTENRISDLNNKIDFQERQINSLNSKIANLESNMNTGNQGIVTNFDNLNDTFLNFYYNNYNNLAFYQLGNRADNVIFSYKNEINRFEPSGTGYLLVLNSYHYLYPNGNITDVNNSLNRYFYPNTLSNDDNQFGFYHFYTDHIIYTLTPYKLTINNENVSINPDNIPYDSKIFYSGQTITLTYDDSNHDFTGWYDINGNLLSNQLEYTFDINQDTTIQVNYNTDHSDNINYDYFIYIILLLSLIFLHDITKGVLN